MINVTMKLHEMDKDMVEIISPDRKMLWGVVHIDMIQLEDRDIYDLLFAGESVQISIAETA